LLAEQEEMDQFFVGKLLLTRIAKLSSRLERIVSATTQDRQRKSIG